ncbi:MAG: MarR family transcriptional regulator [Pseudomonadota bacterium]
MAQSELFELATRIDRLMRRMNASLTARAPGFDPDGVGPVGGMILLTIGDLEPAPMQRIADTMARDKAQLSRMVSALERRGLVERHRHASDKRSSLLSLSQEGAAFVEAIKGVLADTLDDLLDPLDAAERRRLIALLTKIEAR